MSHFEPGEDFARHLDETDPLRHFRERFEIPRRSDGGEKVYLCGNSLGLMPRSARDVLLEELDDWASLAVDAHFKPRRPWYSYHEIFRESGERLVGALPGAGAGEIVMMNSLTVNLHLMMASFYRPTRDRFRVLIESPAFPSDLYAVRTHLQARGVDPDEAVGAVGPREGEHLLRTEDFEATLERHGESIAMLLLGGVNFLTGQALDIERITAAAHAQGCIVGWDLAHAAGNIPLRLHDWNVDFACWCSYKYLNGGPGAVAGCFVHERHGKNLDLPRFGGWWGNDPEKRFRMHLEPQFVPVPGADGWQVSNPPILSMAPLRASLDIFDEATMPALREKSVDMTGYIRWLISQLPESGRDEWFEVITPQEEGAHGCQLSILVHDRPDERFRALLDSGVVCDFRPPNVIRAAPAPLYNTFGDCWRFAKTLTSL